MGLVRRGNDQWQRRHRVACLLLSWGWDPPDPEERGLFFIVLATCTNTGVVALWYF